MARLTAPLNAALRRVPVWLVWVLGLIPLALLVGDTLTGHLGVEPIRDIEHRLGRTAIYFLLGSLTITPLFKLCRLNLIRYRRALGLLCFTYVSLHLLAWAVMDMGLIWKQMFGDVLKRPYLTFGMLAFLLLLPLALTSNNWSIRKLGPARWRRLHTLVYYAVILAAFHYLWVGKVLELPAVLVLGAAGLLLALRLFYLAPQLLPR